MRDRIEGLLDASRRFQSRRLNTLSRVLILAASVLIAVSILFPFWHINLQAPQYPEGLDLWIFGHELVAGREGQDLEEINVLNHYIGMAPILEADFVEMTVIPFALGFFVLFGLRAVVFGIMRNLVDHVVLFLYFAVFSIANFAYRLYSYGHDLDPRAPINPEPFTPALIGTKQIANMTQTSLPHVGSFLLVAAFLALVLAVFWSRREPPHYGAIPGDPVGSPA